MGKKKEKDTKGEAPSTKYEPTDQEKAIETRFLKQSSGPDTTIKVSEDNGFELGHEDQRMGSIVIQDALASQDIGFAPALVHQIANIASPGQDLNELNINFMLSVVKGIEPKDQVESMLGVQMAAVHMAITSFARRLQNVDNIPQQDSAGQLLVKLLRTYTMQMEALRKYRSGGEQKVTVQHVQVNDGGQAVVGNINQGGGGGRKR